MDNQQQHHWNPAAHHHPTPGHPPVGYPLPPAPRRTGLIVSIVVTAVLAIAATTTAIVLATSKSPASAPAGTVAAAPSVGITTGNTGRGAPVVLPSSQAGGAPSTDVDPGPPVASEVPAPPVDVPAPAAGDDPNGGGGEDPNGGSGEDPNGGGDVDPNGSGSSTGNRPTGSPQSLRNDILQSAISWIDARNSGDGSRTLQLGCSDDVSAVQSGQPNPAASAGYTAYRPTGEVIGHSSGLAAYVVISSQNLQTGASQPSRLPIVWEQGAWRMCYYPGAETNRITGG